MQQPTTTTQPSTLASHEYVVRYTSDYLLINDEPVDYGPQILDLDKLYIIVTGPQTKLQTPIVLDRTRDVDELDRKIFFKTFLLEIVKGMEISGFEDAAFILQRVPKVVKYFVGVFQKVSLVRWIQLLGNDSFFLVLYQTLEQLISKRQISKLRTDFIEELIQVHAKAPYARMLFLLQNLLLENENLRNAMVNLTKQIVMKEIEEKRFFEVELLGMSQNVFEKECENQFMDDNKSETDSIPEDKEMPYPENFLYKTINILKSCQKIKITKETITKKIFNSRLFKILKYFFQGFFERQKLQLLEILALASQIQPIKLWKITFDEGRTTRCKTLLLLESLLTNSIISYSDVLKKPRTTKKLANQTLIKENTNQTLMKDNNKKNPQTLPDKDKSWQFVSMIIEKFITINSPERKVFLHKIVNTLLMCRSIYEELDFVMMFLEGSAKDLIYAKKNMEVWKLIVKKIEAWIKDVMNAKKQGGMIVVGSVDKTKCIPNNTMLQNSNTQQPESRKICQESNKLSKPISYYGPCPKLSIAKISLIKLLKIYKILVIQEQKFQINLDPCCLMYLVDMTEKSKGIIEGVRMALIEVLGKRENLIAENLQSDEEYFGDQKNQRFQWD